MTCARPTWKISDKCRGKRQKPLRSKKVCPLPRTSLSRQYDLETGEAVVALNGISTRSPRLISGLWLCTFVLHHAKLLFRLLWCLAYSRRSVFQQDCLVVQYRALAATSKLLQIRILIPEVLAGHFSHEWQECAQTIRSLASANCRCRKPFVQIGDN